MLNNPSYLLDSSIWIDIERKKADLIEKASKLILTHKVCLCDLIVAELLRGVRTDSDYLGLKLRLESFPIYTANWNQVAKLAYKVAKAGFNPPLTDLYIAECAINNKKILVTRDSDFKQIYQVQKFKLELWE